MWSSFPVYSLSDLLSILIQETENAPPTLFDGCSHSPPPARHQQHRYFRKEYACDINLYSPHIKKHLDTSQRADVVWDAIYV